MAEGKYCHRPSCTASFFFIVVVVVLFLLWFLYPKVRAARRQSTNRRPSFPPEAWPRLSSMYQSRKLEQVWLALLLELFLLLFILLLAVFFEGLSLLLGCCLTILLGSQMVKNGWLQLQQT
jgi:hypothetical protein